MKKGIAIIGIVPSSKDGTQVLIIPVLNNFIENNVSKNKRIFGKCEIIDTDEETLIKMPKKTLKKGDEHTVEIGINIDVENVDIETLMLSSVWGFAEVNPNSNIKF